MGMTVAARLDHLKRDLLLVDQIAVVGKSDMPLDTEPGISADIAWLRERELLIFWNFDNSTSVSLKTESGATDVGPDYLVWALELFRSTTFREELIAADGSDHRLAAYGIPSVSDILCRIACLEALALSNNAAVSLYPPTKQVRSKGLVSPRDGTVTSVVLNSLPVPDDATALEDIMSFRDDPVTKRKRQLLQRWTHNLAIKGVTSEAEATQEIEWLLADYEEHMKVHRMKINRGMLETVIVTGAEIAEDLAKFKWGKLAKGLFSASHRKIELMETEMKAPGRELAYISSVRERFQGE
jgi:hypothetical protein